MSTTPTTEQEAVNLMLSAIGEQPVSDIVNSGRPDVTRAKQRLLEKSKHIQSRGWWFNRNTEFEIAPGVDGDYAVPGDALAIEPFDYRIDHFVERGRRLYNTDENTFTGHTKTLKVNTVIGLDFEDLPEEARHYIYIAAARVFADASVADPSLHQWTMQDEALAYRALRARDTTASKHTLFANPETFGTTFRTD